MSYKLNPTTRKLDYYEKAGAAANGLPSGGTAGQILSKIDGTEYNATWSDPTAGYTDADAIAAIQGDASWNATDWDTAYGWGDHSTEGYLTTISGLDHGLLGDLTADDHTQYLLANGTRALSADWDAGSFNIRAASLTADGLTAGRIVFAGTNGLLSDDSSLTYDAVNDALSVGGSATGMSLISSGLTVNNLGGGGANDDFIAKSDNYNAIVVDASADTVTLNAPVTIGLGIAPDANDGAYLGTSALGFSDLFLAEGGVIDWDNGDATLTQTGNNVVLAGASFQAPSIGLGMTASGNTGVLFDSLIGSGITSANINNRITDETVNNIVGFRALVGTATSSNSNTLGNTRWTITQADPSALKSKFEVTVNTGDSVSAALTILDTYAATFAGALTVTTDFNVNGNTTLGNASTDTITCTGRMIVRTLSADPTSSATAGTVGEIAYYNNKFYGKITGTGTDTNWSALN